MQSVDERATAPPGILPVTLMQLSNDGPDAAWVRAAQRRRWRRRMLPIAGGAALLFFWWALVTVFQVRPFIAPAPQVVAVTFVHNFGMLMNNLAPTATEAVCGFLLGNFAAIVTATVFVHAKTM